ncbi:chymotrypsin inhibitor [Megalopta genalis]|uniref:chymotrypsin inhibitor n=1 Tax=Megalopta genalis TaxID=115081 RepID=UPI0014430AEF|nr:chymotrypsin inhibitor-like [Megalopta genalis]
MTRSFFILFAVLAVFSAGSYGQQCGENEQFNSCGSACEPSCSNPSPQICTMQCVIGCQCKPGFLRSSGGVCVSPGSC